jgi:hypothetical protein
MPPSPSSGMRGPLALRFAVEHLEAYYTDASRAGPTKPSSKRIGDRFSDQTAADGAIATLRKIHFASSDEHLKAAAALCLFLVPAARVPPTG